MKENTARIISQLPVDVATFLLNEKREVIRSVEQRHNVAIVLVPNTHLHTPQYEVKRLRKDEGMETTDGIEPVSYQLTEAPELAESSWMTAEIVRPEEPAVKGIAPTSPAPSPQAAPPAAANGEGGFIKRLWSSLFGATKPEPEPIAAPIRSQPPSAPRQTGGANKQGGKASGGQRGRRGGATGGSRRGADQRRSPQKGEASASGTNRNRPPENKPAAPPAPQPAGDGAVSANETAETENRDAKATAGRGDGQTREGSQRSGRRRGRRGGSGRRRREEAARNSGDASEGSTAAEGAGRTGSGGGTDSAPATAPGTGNEERSRQQPQPGAPETAQRPLFDGGEDRSPPPRPAPPVQAEKPSGGDQPSSPAAASGGQTALPWDGGNRPAADKDKGSTVERVVSSIDREAPAVKDTTTSGGAHAAPQPSRESTEGDPGKAYHDEHSDKSGNL